MKGTAKFNSDHDTQHDVIMDLEPDWHWSLNPEMDNKDLNWWWEVVPGAVWGKSQTLCCWLQELEWFNNGIFLLKIKALPH